MWVWAYMMWVWPSGYGVSACSIDIVPKWSPSVSLTLCAHYLVCLTTCAPYPITLIILHVRIKHCARANQKNAKFTKTSESTGLDWVCGWDGKPYEGGRSLVMVEQLCVEGGAGEVIVCPFCMHVR